MYTPINIVLLNLYKKINFIKIYILKDQLS
jgi:hypothetical protein